MDIEFTEENISRLFGQEAAEDEDFERLQSIILKIRLMQNLLQIYL